MDAFFPSKDKLCHIFTTISLACGGDGFES